MIPLGHKGTFKAPMDPKNIASKTTKEDPTQEIIKEYEKTPMEVSKETTLDPLRIEEEQ
jgi:hypothetical protein